MKFSAKSASLFLGISALAMTTTPAMEALSAKQVAAYAAGSYIAGTAFQFWTRDGDNKPDRAQWCDAFTLNPTKLWQIQADKIAGHAGKKSSAIIEIDDSGKATGKLVLSEKVAPRGLGGLINTYWKPVKNTVYVLALLAIVNDALQKSGGLNRIAVGNLDDATKNITLGQIATLIPA